MFVISYLDQDGNRYDAAKASMREDAEFLLGKLQLNDARLEERDTYNPKPIDYAAFRLANQVARANAQTANLSATDGSLSTIKLTDVSLPTVDAKIDAISNLADAKVFLKLIARFVAKKFAQIES